MASKHGKGKSPITQEYKIEEVRNAGRIVSHLLELWRSRPAERGARRFGCSDVVEANGGSIEGESEEGEGSTFAVLLSVKELAS